MATLIPKYDQGATGAVNRAINLKLAEQVSVLDFGADPTGVADSTTAFTNAQTASKNVFIPAGTYLLDGLRIQNGVNLIGAGYNNSILVQKSTGTPAINCTSDVTVGQLGHLNLSNFSVQGKTGATVASFVIYAAGAYAVYNSTFDFESYGGYQALNAIGATATNIYQSKVKLYSVNTTATSVYLAGFGYSEFDLFLSQSQSGVALDESTSSSTFTRLITEGQIILRGSSTYINPTVELIVGTALPAGSSVIECLGSGQVLVKPYIILDASSSAKATYAIRPFTNTVLINPFISATSALANPFASAFANKWTLVGPGGNSCPNKIETIYLDTNDNAQNMRTVSLVGDCSAFSSGNIPAGGKAIQYTTGTGSGTPTITMLNNSDAILIDYSGTCTDLYINTPYFPVNGQVISFYTRSAITNFHWNGATSGATVTLFPASATAGAKFSMIYNAANTTYYPI